MSSLTDNFKTAAERLKTLNSDPGNETKLKLYALFKQVNNIFSTEVLCSYSFSRYLKVNMLIIYLIW